MIKILYVEDDAEYAELIQQHLAQAEFETVIASTAAKAEKLFREFRPEIALVDLDLQHEKEGLEVIRHIQSQSRWFPLIVHSAHVEPEVVIETMNCGVLHHVGKERTISELIAAIKNALRQAYHCKDMQNPEYRLSDITTYNFSTRTLTINGSPILLKAIPNTLLKQLCLHINEFVSPEELSFATWGIQKNLDDIRRYIAQLRKIIEPNDPNIKLLNQSGGHYQLECEKWKECVEYAKRLMC